MTTETVFHNLCHELGIPPAFGLLYQLPLHIGLGTARRVLLREKRIDAQRALDLGLVDEVVPPDQLEERAKAVACELGELPGQVVGGIKRMLLQHLPNVFHPIAPIPPRGPPPREPDDELRLPDAEVRGDRRKSLTRRLRALREGADRSVDRTRQQS